MIALPISLSFTTSSQNRRLLKAITA